MKRKKSKHQSLLGHDLGRFKLWAYGFEDSGGQFGDGEHRSRVPTGPPGLTGDAEAVDSRLDEVLERTEYLKAPTIMLLSSFTSVLLMTHFKKCTSILWVCSTILLTAALFLRSLIVGDDTTRALVKASLAHAISIYPYLKSDWDDADSDQSRNSAIEELHDIVDSLFELAQPLNDVLEMLQVPTDLGLLPITESYKNFLIDKFPNAGRHLVLRFAEGNTECHEQLRAQAAHQEVMYVG